MEEKKRDFSQFRLKMRPKARGRILAPLSENSYSRWSNLNRAVDDDFSLEEILEIIRSGNLEEYQRLSRYYYRTNGEYRNNIDYLASLFLYDHVVIPVFDGEGSEAQILKTFLNACDFVEKLDLSNILNHITKEWLITGVYNGILRVNGSDAVIQDLPLEYCRTRFKDFNNLNILEFNINYFSRFSDEATLKEALETFPEVVQQAWKNREKVSKINNTTWVPIFPADGGICFTFTTDPTPLLLASIPALKQLSDAVKREEKRDENELYKLLIQKMPIDNKGELVFELDEVAEIHASVADMLKEIETVDVLTTFGDATLENLQETTAASQSNDRIEKYKNNAFNALGRSALLFNAEGSSTLAYSIKKDEAVMMSFLNIYEAWIRFQLNMRFTRNGLKFEFELLPTTVFNRSDLQQIYFRGAQYGYSKMIAGVSMGIKQTEQLSLIKLENDYLKMSEKMIPLQSSYTTSGTSVANEEKNNSTSGEKTIERLPGDNLNNKGGRPELPDEQKSEKTQANIAAAG